MDLKTEKLIILQLSDAHIGKSSDGIDELIVLDPLLEDLVKIKEEKGLIPNVIVFSGDLIQGCKNSCGESYCRKGEPYNECKVTKQLEKAKEFINKIYERLKISIAKVPIIIVPGNHDVNRNILTLDQIKARETYKINEIDERQKNPYEWNNILKAQSKWYGFASSFNEQNNLEWDSKYKVPYYKLKMMNKSVGISGLNTSWASFSDNDKDRLWVGKNQIDTILNKFNDCDFKILISHHPPSWLNMEEEKNIERTISSNFNIYIHGHEHSEWFLDSNNYLKIEGGAIYEGSDKPNGYAWIEIDFKKEKGRIYLREFKNEGKAAWTGREIKDKTNNEGIAEIKSLFIDNKKNILPSESEPHTHIKTPKKKLEEIKKKPSIPKKTETLEEYIIDFENRFHLRWERRNFVEQSTIVFWPVRLRKPTAIHAAQSFVASALEKKGCVIYLFLDDFAQKHVKNDFLKKIEYWFNKVNGNYDNIIIKEYSDYDKNHNDTKKKILEDLTLKDDIKTIDILKISKILHEKSNPDEIMKALIEKRPRRLLTPAMTWTCLDTLIKENTNKSIITLGGYDERSLWKTWDAFFRTTDTKNGHLYISELEGLHMADKKFDWVSKEDIRKEFDKYNKDTHLDSEHNMIPWCINNCTLLPKYIVKEDELTINSVIINNTNDLKKLKLTNVDMNQIVDEVFRWVI